MNRKLIGINGYARSGKDTFFERSKIYLEREGKKCIRFAFADALKSEIDPLLLNNVGISAFTEKDSEKEVIRPLLVTYGTDIRRKINPNCWIEVIQSEVIKYLNQGYYVFITDVRFENEAHWVKLNGGLMVNIERLGVLPANHEEHRQKVLMKKHLNYKISWPTYGEDSIENCDEHVVPNLSHILSCFSSESQKGYEQVL